MRTAVSVAALAVTLAVMSAPSVQGAPQSQDAGLAQIAEMAQLCDPQLRKAVAFGTVTDMKGRRVTVRPDLGTVIGSSIIDDPIDTVQRAFDTWVPYEKQSGGLGALAVFYTCIYDIRMKQLEGRDSSGPAAGGSGPRWPDLGKTELFDRSTGNALSDSGGADDPADPKSYSAKTRDQFLGELRAACATELAAHVAAWSGIDDPLGGEKYFDNIVGKNAGEVEEELAGIGNGDDATSKFQRCVLQARLEQLHLEKPGQWEERTVKTPPRPAPPAPKEPTPQEREDACLAKAGITDRSQDPEPPPTDPATSEYQAWARVGGPVLDAVCKQKRIAYFIAVAAVCEQVPTAISFYTEVWPLTNRDVILDRIIVSAKRRAQQSSRASAIDRAGDDWNECLLNERLNQLPKVTP
jgi:hypothetical protein